MLSQLIRTGVVAALTMAAIRSPANAAPSGNGLADLPAVAPVMACADVTSLDLPSATDAPVTIHSATVVTTGAPGSRG